MPQFASREEYEEWKDGKIVASQQFPTDSYQDTYKSRKSCSGITAFIVITIVVMSGVFVYLEYFRMNIAWTDTSYTNLTLGFSVDLPEGWKKFEFRPELKRQIDTFTVAGTRTLFMLSPNNSENTVYGIMDMQKVIPPDREDAGEIITAEITKAKGMFSSLGFETAPVSVTIDGRDTSFLRATQGDAIFVTGIILNPKKNVLMYQFYDLMGRTEQEFWASARSLQFIEN